METTKNVRPNNIRKKLEDVVPLQAPFTVMIDPCGACNLTCNFCPCNTVEENKFERHKMMDYNLFLKVVEDLKEFKGEIKVISLFSYGESLLNPKLPEMIALIKEENLCREIRIMSNGLPLTPKLADKLIHSGLDYFEISLNGLTAEDYLKDCNTIVNFGKFYDNMKYFYEKSRGSKTRFFIKTTSLCIHSAEREELFHRLFDPISDDTLVHDVINQWSEFEVKELSAEGNSKDAYAFQKANHDICTYPLTFLGIHSNGQVSPCCVDWNFKVILGDVTTKSVKDIWNGEKLFQLRMKLLKRERVDFCDGCSFRMPDSVDTVTEKVMNQLIEGRGKV